MGPRRSFSPPYKSADAPYHCAELLTSSTISVGLLISKTITSCPRLEVSFKHGLSAVYRALIYDYNQEFKSPSKSQELAFRAIWSIIGPASGHCSAQEIPCNRQRGKLQDTGLGKVLGTGQVVQPCLNNRDIIFIASCIKLLLLSKS